jgi:hypothetical protein
VGREEALALGEKHPVVLTLPADGIRDVIAALEGLVGWPRAVAVVRGCPQVLDRSSDEVREAFGAVVEVLGWEAAVAAAEAHGKVLACSATTVRESMTHLVEVLGQQKAQQAVERHPDVLASNWAQVGLERKRVGQLNASEHNAHRIPTRLSRNAASAMWCGVFHEEERGTEASSTTAATFIRILQVACEGGTRGAMAVLVEVLGQESAVAVVADDPRALTLRVETIRKAMAALVKLMGHRQAVAAVEREPHLLTSAQVTV